jgi:hypothetical protein
MRLAYSWRFYFKTMTKEIWKVIPNFESYLASNLGNIKSLNYMNTGIPTLLKQYEKKDGYMTVALCKNGKQKRFDVQVLIAMAFLGHVPCGHEIEVDHKNGIRTDNRVENLQLLSGAEHRRKPKKIMNTSSQYTGVYWDKIENKWLTQIYIDGKRKYLGRFKDEYEAHLSYQKALNELK